jgi:transcriptional regulator with XRE-family HTH domain
VFDCAEHGVSAETGAGEQEGQASMTSNDRTPNPAAQMGPNIRAARLVQGMSLRELARRIGVSPSFISQLEHNKTNASVGTLYALVDVLGISLDQLMAGAPNAGAPIDASPLQEAQAHPFAVTRPVQSAEGRPQIQFPGVLWQRLTQTADPNVDFLHVTYAPGSSSSEADDMMRHGGHEYGYVLSGTLSVQVGFESYELGPGDAITFDSMTPHRLSNRTDANAEAVWVVVGRRDDHRAREVPSPASSVTHLPALRS